jgi:hypothetical protein
LRFFEGPTMFHSYAPVPKGHKEITVAIWIEGILYRDYLAKTYMSIMFQEELETYLRQDGACFKAQRNDNLDPYLTELVEI